MEAW
jgi:5-oxoprolinase (ATP-hydrolysing)